jgi:hypothetical protein
MHNLITTYLTLVPEVAAAQNEWVHPQQWQQAGAAAKPLRTRIWKAACLNKA